MHVVGVALRGCSALYLYVQTLRPADTVCNNLCMRACVTRQGARHYLNMNDQASAMLGVRRLFDAADAAGMMLFSKVGAPCGSVLTICRRQAYTLLGRGKGAGFEASCQKFVLGSP